MSIFLPPNWLQKQHKVTKATEFRLIIILLVMLTLVILSWAVHSIYDSVVVSIERLPRGKVSGRRLVEAKPRTPFQPLEHNLSNGKENDGLDQTKSGVSNN